MQKLLPYGINNFKDVISNCYYIDKTMFIPKLEQYGRFLYLIGHRGFGKNFGAIKTIQKDNFISLLYYLGYLTIVNEEYGHLKLKIPNQTIRQIIALKEAKDQMKKYLKNKTNTKGIILIFRNWKMEHCELIIDN